MTARELQDADIRTIVTETHLEVTHLKEAIQELKSGKWANCAEHDAKIASIQNELTGHKRDTSEQFKQVWGRMWWMAGLPISLLFAVAAGIGVYFLTH